jgi:hypothetical protein
MFFGKNLRYFSKYVQSVNRFKLEPNTLANTVKDIKWIEPTIMKPSESNYILPADPGSFPSTPSGKLAEQKFFEQVAASLPPNDIYRIPLELSKPWFDYVLWTFCASLALVVALTGDWDGLNEGHPHIFSSFQPFFKSQWNKLWEVSLDDEEIYIKERLKKI